jgi:transcriptional regulator of heat shock response
MRAEAGGDTKKRKRDDLEAQLEAQGQQIESLQQTSSELLEKLTGLKQLLSEALVGVESREAGSPEDESS